MTVANVVVLVEMDNISTQRKNEVSAMLGRFYRPGITGIEEVRRADMEGVTLYVAEIRGQMEVDEDFIDHLGGVVVLLGGSFSLTLEAGDGQPEMRMLTATAARRFKPVEDLLRFGSDYRLELHGASCTDSAKEEPAADETPAPGNMRFNGKRATVHQMEGYDLSIRQLLEGYSSAAAVANLLKAEGVEVVKDLVTKTEAELQRIPRIGPKSVTFLKDELARYGLALGMKVEGFRREFF